MQTYPAFRRRLTAALLPIIALAAASPVAHAQNPLISAFAGTGSNTYFFAMDFRDFAAPQSCAFGFRSNAASLTFQQILQGLAPVPTFSAQISVDPTFGASLNGLSYSGKTKFNDFAGNNSGEPNGYWSQWNSPNGINWNFDDFGIGGQSIGAGQWVGASWTSDFNTVTDAPPRVPQITSTAAPEPASCGLLVLGGGLLSGQLCARRRRRG